MLNRTNMFSLFQDHDVTSLERSSTNDAPLACHEQNSGGSDNKIELRLGQRSIAVEQQDSWCSEVLKLKKDLQTPKPLAPAVPFQHFHSTRKLNLADATPVKTEQLLATSVTAPKYDSAQSNPIVQAVPVVDVKATNSELSEVRHVRFIETPIPVDCKQSRRSAKRKPSMSKRVYWTREEVDCMKRAALRSARAFRLERPAAVKRLKQLFEEICWKHSNCSDDSAETIDEEAEEVLHRFLADWGMSTVRGLEERVVPRKVFDQDRRLAQESVLAYQQLLRESGVYSPTEMEAMLSVRSESASRKARMFAMYMALGDALAVSAFQADEIYGSDEDSITFA